MQGHSQSDLILPENDLERRVLHSLIARAIAREWPVREGTGQAEEVCVISFRGDEDEPKPNDEGWFLALATLKYPEGGWVMDFAPLRGKVGVNTDGRTVVYHFPHAPGFPFGDETNHGRPDLEKRQFPVDPMAIGS